MRSSNFSVKTRLLKVFCQGIFDVLVPEEGISMASVRIGRDTGSRPISCSCRDTKKIRSDSRHRPSFLMAISAAGKHRAGFRDAAGPGTNIPILFLPGKEAPEGWVWERLRHIPEEDASQLGVNRASLSNVIRKLDAIYDSASDSASEIAKNKFRSLSESLRREASEICRIVARLEADRKESDIQPLVGEFARNSETVGAGNQMELGT